MVDELSLAFDRVEDFVAVQHSLSATDLGPILCLQEALGIGEAERRCLLERIERVADPDHVGAVALGLLVGLLAAQFGAEVSPPRR